MHAIKRCLASTTLAFAVSAHATVLTFDGFGDNEIVLQSYGDRVTDFGAVYGSAGGPTPNIVVDYVPVTNNIPLTNWTSGYASLTNALSSIEFDTQGFVQLMPDPGYDVILNNFQVGAWADEAFPGSRVFVTQGTGATVFDTGTFTFPPFVVETYPGAPLRSSSGFRIHVHDFGDLGIDNIAFSQVPTIPEPEQYLLWLSGLGLIALTIGKSRGRRRGPRG
jgi:hypothetical protein